MFLLTFLDFSFITTTLLFSVVSLCTFFWYQKLYNHYWKGKGIPSEKPLSMILPFIRAMFSKTRNITDVEQELYKKHGSIYGNYEFFTPTLTVADPDLLKLIFVKDFNVFNRRRDIGTIGRLEYFNDFMVIAEGEKWKRLRHIVSPAFTSGKLRAMMNGIGSTADQFAQNLLKAAESDEPINCKLAGDCFVLDSIAKSAFGTQLDSLNDQSNVFVQQARKAFGFDEFNWLGILFFIAPRLFFKLGMDFAPFKFFAELTKSIVERRMENKEVHHDFLQMLLDHLEDSEHTISDNQDQNNKDSKKVVSMRELVAQCLLFFLGGFDNVATTLSLVLHLLAMHPEVQEKLIEDVDKYWKNQAEEDFSTSSGARYVEACISETLRLYPTATRAERRPNADYPLGDTGFIVPKDVIVQIPIYCLHRDEKYFPEPDKFIPERFLPENADNLNNSAYIPFGGGPRNCVAMRFALLEIKVCLLNLFRHIKFAPCPQTKDPPEFAKAPGIIHTKKMFLNILKRETSSL